MISELVAAYLRKNKRLVIPGLGAFIRKDGSSEVVFVEFLKKDDGVLAGLLEDQYGLSRVEALETITQYVERVKQHVAHTGHFVVGGVGILHANSNSLLELEYDSTISDREFKSPVSMSTRVKEVGQGSGPRPAGTTAESVRQVVATPNAPKPNPARKQEESVRVRPAVGQRFEPGGRKPEGVRPEAVRKNVEVKRPSVVSVSTGVAKPLDRPMSGQIQGDRVSSETRPYVPRNKKKKADLIMIIAILAALLAIGVMVYSMFAQMNTGENLLEVTPVVQDTVAVEK